MDTTDVTAVLSPDGSEIVVEKGSLPYDAIAEFVDPPFRTWVTPQGWVMVATVKGDMGKPSGLVRNPRAEQLAGPAEPVYGTVLITGYHSRRLQERDIPVLRLQFPI